MTNGRPKGASTGRLLLNQLVHRAQDEQSFGHDRVDGQMHSVDERRLAGRGLGGERRRPAKKLATAVPAAPGGVREDPEPLLDALTASGITDALCARENRVVGRPAMLAEKGR